MADEKSTQSLPKILATEVVAKSKLFCVEQLNLEFNNGNKRVYERMKGGGRGAVMILPMPSVDTMLLIREYAAGNHSYQLGFPKGLIDPGETPEQAANRELKEEIGMGAKTFVHLTDLALAPSYFNAQMSVFIASDLYPESLEGDEPEPLEVLEWRLNDYKSLLGQPDFTEARSIASLMLMLDHFKES